MRGEFFYHLPLSVVYLFTVLLVLLALAGGVLLGHRSAARGGLKDASVGSAVAATLGLLGFLLAFMFSMTAGRFSERRELLLDEANAIGTAYLRTDFLKPGAVDKAKALLVEYTAVNEVVPGPHIEKEVSARISEIQRALWNIVDEHIRENYNPGYLRLFVEPLNDVMDFHTARSIVRLEYRIPVPIWAGLYFMSVLAMFGIGFQFGVNRGVSLHVALALALTFATVILLIADLDRATAGALVLDQQPMVELHQQLEQAERRRKALRGD